MEAASPALLRLVCQTLFVICYMESEALSKQQPDPSMRKSSVPQQLCRLQTCKRLLIAMQVSIAYECTSLWMLNSPEDCDSICVQLIHILALLALLKVPCMVFKTLAWYR